MLYLRLFPDPTLRKKALEVTDFTKIAEKTTQMLTIMKDNKGVGLAANQVGLLERVFVMQLNDSVPQIFVNPVIIQSSKEKFRYEEGCLSLPGITASVSRAKTITLKWQDLDEVFHEEQFEDLASTCIQHEIDHLDGILFPDRTHALTSQKLWKKLQAFLKKSS